MKKSIKAYKLDFLDYIKEIRGYSDLTLRTYDIALDEMLANAHISDSEIDLMPLRLKIASQSSATISKKLSAIRSFVSYLDDLGEELKLKNDESVKLAKKLPKPVSDLHVREALDVANSYEKLVVLMIYTLGLRISELAGIRLENIKEGWIRVEGKGAKERDIPVIAELAQLIRQYRMDAQPQHYLFEFKGQKLSENSLRYTITKLFKTIGIKVSPHQLRHSFASTLLNHDARIADVSELLGHASMATTQIYTKLSNRLKMDNYMKSHPLCKADDETH